MLHATPTAEVNPPTLRRSRYRRRKGLAEGTAVVVVAGRRLQFRNVAAAARCPTVRRRLNKMRAATLRTWAIILEPEVDADEGLADAA